MNQKARILYLLQTSPDNKVTCAKLMQEFLFHKASSRISELKDLNYDIRYVKGNTVYESYYQYFPKVEQMEFKVA